MKQKHQNVIAATITLHRVFDPADLAAAAEIQKSILTDARALSGFSGCVTAMKKVPVEAKPADVASIAAANASLEIPPAMKR